jgi:hypothetical protein
MTIPTSGEISFSDFYIPAGVAEDIPSGGIVTYETSGGYDSADFEGIVAYDPNTAGRFVVAYRTEYGSPDRGAVRVGNVSGSAGSRTITWGSAYVFTGSSGTYTYPSVCFDPHNAGKFLVTYKDSNSSNRGASKIGTITNTNQVSFGSISYYNDVQGGFNSSQFDPNTANKVVLCYQDWGGSPSYQGEAVVGTVSGTSISWGTAANFHSGSDTHSIDMSFDPNNSNKFVVIFKDFSDNSYGKARVGTISGTSISFGTEVAFHSASTDNITVDFDPNTTAKCLVTYRDAGSSSHTKVVVGTLSGTSISFGSETTIQSDGYGQFPRGYYDPTQAGKVVFLWVQNFSPRGLYCKTATVTGTTVGSFGTAHRLTTDYVKWPEVSFDPSTSGEFVITYKAGSGNKGVGVIGQVET